MRMRGRMKMMMKMRESFVDEEKKRMKSEMAQLLYLFGTTP